MVHYCSDFGWVSDQRQWKKGGLCSGKKTIFLIKQCHSVACARNQNVWVLSKDSHHKSVSLGHTRNTVDPLTCKAIYIRVSLTIPNHCLFLCMEIDIAMEMEGRCIIIASLWLKSILGFMSKSATYFYPHLESGGHFNWWNLFLWLDIIHIGHCLIHL